MSQTESITTEHGRIEYETVDCDSCGAEVAEKDADRFVVIHDLRDKTDWHDHTEYECHDHTEGWICPHCADSGPIDTPDKPSRNHILGWMLWATFSDRPIHSVTKIGMLGLAGVLLLMSIDAAGIV